jgi:hypothetical protein
VVEAFEVLEVPAKSSSSFPNVFIGNPGFKKSISSGFPLSRE